MVDTLSAAVAPAARVAVAVAVADVVVAAAADVAVDAVATLADPVSGTADVALEHDAWTSSSYVFICLAD